MKNRKLIVALAVVAVAAFIGGQTLSYFTDTDSDTNTFTVGDLDIDEDEPDWHDGEDGKDMYPGYVKYKNPTVTNVTDESKGDSPAYVRMRVSLLGDDNQPVSAEAAELIWKTIRFDDKYRFESGTGTAAGSILQELTTDTEGLTEAALQSFPTVNPLFTLAAGATATQRVYNYTGGAGGSDQMKSGESATLFTTVVIPSDWDQEKLDLIGSYQIKITSEAIQIQGFADQAAAFTALDASLTSAGNEGGSGTGGTSEGGSGQEGGSEGSSGTDNG